MMFSNRLSCKCYTAKEMELLRRIFEQDQVVYAALEAYAEDQVLV
jgi:hypothetical protein